jgi:hypothetical protein
MRIRELTGYKSNILYQKAKEIFSPSQKDVKLDIQFDQWTEIMSQNGFTHLGSGSFGSVYEKDGYPWVFKIFKADPAYLKFFKFARRNQNNPNLPKIKGGLIQINNETFAVRIEKLREITRNEFLKVDEIVNTFIDIIADERTPDELEPDEYTMFKQHYNLYEIVYALWNSDTFKHTILDIHGGNIMMRGNTPVLSDPVISGQDGTL